MSGAPTTCPWLVWVPTGNPEPDQEFGLGGMYVEGDCGAPVEALTRGDGTTFGWACEAGHHHLDYGSREQQVEERHEAMAELAAHRDERADLGWVR